MYEEDETIVQTSFTEGIILVPHCVSNVNTHGSLKLTLFCIDLECTRLLKLTLVCFKHECTWSGVCMCFNLEHTWILEHIHATSLQLNYLVACPCSLSEVDCLCLQYVVIQQLFTEELFSQLPIDYCCYAIAIASEVLTFNLTST